MKPYLLLFTVAISAPALSLTQIAQNQIVNLDVPYAITHVSEFETDCVWTLSDKGHLESHATRIDGPGICWTAEASSHAEKLHAEAKLTWHQPPVFDYEYGDKQRCHYRVDKASGIADYRLGENATQEDWDKCVSDASKKEALERATKVDRILSFGGYQVRKSDVTGAVALACYTGSIDTNSPQVSGAEKSKRHAALLNLHAGDGPALARINKAYRFAMDNLSDRFPLDRRGNLKASICDQMLMDGKL